MGAREESWTAARLGEEILMGGERGAKKTQEWGSCHPHPALGWQKENRTPGPTPEGCRGRRVPRSV